MAKDKEDGVELLATGKVKITIDGDVYTFRRPKVKEFREMQSEGTAIVKDKEGKEREEIEAAELIWMHGYLSSLCDKELPEPDELPLYFVGADFIRTLNNHWAAVPLVRSES